MFVNKTEKVSLFEEVTFKQRLGGGERVIYVSSLENAMQAEVTTSETQAG